MQNINKAEQNSLIKNRLKLLTLLFLLAVTACDETGLTIAEKPMLREFDQFFFAQGYIQLENMIDADYDNSYSITKYADVLGDVDFVAYYTNADGFSITSPNNPLLKGLENYSNYIEDQSAANETQFKMVSASDTSGYSALKTEQQLKDFFVGAGSTVTSVNRLKQGNYIAFRTEEGNYGVMIMTSSPSGSGGDNSYINMRIKLWR